MTVRSFNEANGTYVGIRLDEESAATLVALQNTLRLKNPLNSDDFHATVLFSRTVVDVIPTDKVHTGVVKYIDVFEQQNGKYAVVAKLDCPTLEERHYDLRSIGGTHDFPTYQPHVTLSYDDYVTPMEVTASLTLIDEYVEPLNLDWVEDDS